ncbi:MAG: hypothetical protein F6K09_06325, partial [Merismopedia sp. SIO2A8]|nr:hypothetical protein [Merismopedia sp. SIO2A8]
VESVQSTLDRCSAPVLPNPSPTPAGTNTNQANADNQAASNTDVSQAGTETASTGEVNPSRPQVRNCDRLTLLQETQETLKEDPNTIFPIVPVYKCTENPALAIAEQALIDRGLEPASTKLCR